MTTREQPRFVLLLYTTRRFRQTGFPLLFPSISLYFLYRRSYHHQRCHHVRERNPERALSVLLAVLLEDNSGEHGLRLLQAGKRHLQGLNDTCQLADAVRQVAIRGRNGVLHLGRQLAAKGSERAF